MSETNLAFKLRRDVEIFSDVNASAVGSEALHSLYLHARRGDELIAALTWVMDHPQRKVHLSDAHDVIMVEYPHNDHERYRVVRAEGESFKDFVLKAFRTRGGTDV